jgi:osmotically-inducible protein OsmY
MMLADQKIAQKIVAEIKTNPELAKHANINVTSFAKVVLLTGQVPNDKLRQAAQKLSQRIPGIKSVYNGLSIQKPLTNLVHASDSWLTTKVKAAFLATNGLKSASVKVITEDSTVYLLGTAANNKQANLLFDIATQITGTKKVIAILQVANKSAIIDSNIPNPQQTIKDDKAKDNKDSKDDNESAVINEVPFS